MDILEAAEILQKFEKVGLGDRIGQLEDASAQKKYSEIEVMLSNYSVQLDTLKAAITIKRLAGQINVVIHAVGILLSLPYILEGNEVIEALSLGAGNTGKPFDLETDKRVAEFKFINWREKRNTIRQNQLFKDFFLLAEHETTKRKCLYVLGIEMPLKFLRGGRALSSVLSRNVRIGTQLMEKYGSQFATVREYYDLRREAVELIDLFEELPEEIKDLFKSLNT